jgi:hypothetical protein
LDGHPLNEMQQPGHDARRRHREQERAFQAVEKAEHLLRLVGLAI